MESLVRDIDGGKVQITFTLTDEERAAYEARALQHVGAELTVKGFRKGHAPEELVRQHAGHEELEQEMLFQAFRRFYPEFIREQNLEVIGEPSLALQSHDPFVFHVTSAKLPHVDLGKWEKVRVKRKAVSVEEKEVTDMLTDLRESRASEASVTRLASAGDRIEMDYELSMGGVPLEGGSYKNHGAILGKQQLLPGFEEQVLGMKPGEEKTFDFTFPADFKADLAGKTAQAKVKLTSVFERTVPEATDEFAKSLGKIDSLNDLVAKLRQNLAEERNAEEAQRLEREMLETLVDKATFGPIPELLLASEAEKMLHELRHGIEERGLPWADYLANLKKDEAALKKEFSKPADRRVRVALLVRTFSKQFNLEADEEEVEADIASTISRYGDDERVAAQVATEDYHLYVKNILTNRKVIAWLTEKLVE
jgi:trigger factor